MKIPKTALLSIALMLIVLSFMFSITSNYSFTVTGRSSMPANIATFSLSLVAVFIIVFVLRGPGGAEVDYKSIYSKSGRRGGSDEGNDDIAYPMGSKSLDKIFQIASAYVSKTHLVNRYSKSNPVYVINKILPDIKYMLFKNPDYLNTVPAIKKTLEGIYKNKDDLKNDKEGARKYLEELNREFNELFASYG